MWRFEATPLHHRNGRWVRRARIEVRVSGARIEQIRPLMTGRNTDKWVMLPGFHDSHVHLRAAAAARLSVDLSVAGSIPALLAILQTSVAEFNGRWIRGWGWDESALRERRAPTVAEIDAITNGHPCALHHRTGKVVLLNSTARRILAGAGDETAPTGELVRADDPSLLRMPRQREQSLESSLNALSRELAAMGLTSVTEASATNTWDDIAQYETWVNRGVIRQRVNALLAVDQVSAVARNRERTPSRGGVRVLGAKVAAPSDGIAECVRHARGFGWPVAVHATEPDELEAALVAIEASGPPAWGRDRIEHLGLPLPGQLERIKATGTAVTTNPAFLTERAPKYRELLSPVEQEWLYPVASVISHGIPMAGASDRPVTVATPLDTMSAAVYRRRRGSGTEPLGVRERITPDDALGLITDKDEVDGPSREGWNHRRASHSPWSRTADTVVLGDDPRRMLEQTQVMATFVGGCMMWRREK
ncbi:amidohydrolase family protein [Microbacterium profundi]|nr:amidohydrolase family protein [Microbacterium profundi]